MQEQPVSVASLLQQHHQQQIQLQQQEVQQQQQMQQQQEQPLQEQEIEVFVPPKELNVPASMELVSIPKVAVKTVVLLCLPSFVLQVLHHLSYENPKLQRTWSSQEGIVKISSNGKEYVYVYESKQCKEGEFWVAMFWTL